MSSAAIGVPPLSAAVDSRSAKWIESPGFDLFFFILSPLVMLPFIFGAIYRIPHVFAIGIVLGFPHYFSSLSFYFWDENRQYHRQRWLAFYAGPLILAAIYGLLIVYRVPLVLQFILFFWNTFHVARQNCGFLSIYRHRAGIFDAHQKNVANFAILATCTWLALWNIGTHKEVYPILLAIHPRFPQLLWSALGVVSLFGIARLGLALWKRRRENLGPGVPEMAFLITSLAFFYPYTWRFDSEFTTFAMLLPHFWQYLGIVWLLHRRKFRESGGSLPQVVLSKLSSNLLLLVPSLLAIGMAFWVGSYLSRKHGWFSQFETVYLLVAFEHYYLDGVFWAFRRPHIRKSLSPYLVRGSNAEAELAA